MMLTSMACSKGAHTEDTVTKPPLDSGIEALRAFDFNRSYELFQHMYATSSHEDKDWPLITYNYGISAWLRTPTTAEDVTLATKLLSSVTEQYPDSIYSAVALLDLGRISEVSDFRGDPTDVTQARIYYQRVRTEFPNSEMSTRATLFLAQTYAQTLEQDNIYKAISMLEACILQETNEKWIGVLALYLGELYNSYLKQPENAVDPLMLAFKSGLPRPSSADSHLWTIGMLAEKAGRDSVALEAYRRIINDYPRTVFRSVSQERIRNIQMKHPDA